MHVTTSNKPLKRADVKAALGTKDVQGRRHLLSSVAGTIPTITLSLCHVNQQQHACMHTMLHWCLVSTCCTLARIERTKGLGCLFYD